MDSDAIVAVVFFSCASVVTLVSILVLNVRKAIEARHRSPQVNNDEVNALRHEVAHLHEKMNDILLQLEFNKTRQPSEISDRISPPEFNKH
ncbi:MAG: hypothetical protein ACKVQS_03655 [Fimbriimonadaceae bacterium]